MGKTASAGGQVTYIALISLTRWAYEHVLVITDLNICTVVAYNCGQVCVKFY